MTPEQLGQGLGHAFFQVIFSKQFLLTLLKMWPLWLLAFLLFVLGDVIEPRILKRIDSWKKGRKK